MRPLSPWSYTSRMAMFTLVLAGGCSSLTSPPEREVEPKQVQPAPTATAPREPPNLIPVQAPPSKEDERISASHILVSFKGARGVSTDVKRTKDQARKRAQEVLKKAKAGTDFGALAKQYSDDPGSGPRGGDLGAFTRKMMVQPFSEAAFALKPGEVSGIVESEFGFHVIKRTQ
jgi:PPIC-type PPIASE domain